VQSLKIYQQFSIHRRFLVRFVSWLVAIHGIFLLAIALLDALAAGRTSHLTGLIVDVHIWIGLSLVYLSSLLVRQKQTAWLVAVLAYFFLLGLDSAVILNLSDQRHFPVMLAVKSLLVPLMVLILLLGLRREFKVRSDIQGFRSALKFAVIVLSVTIVYGVSGFMLLDKSDFHQEFTITEALHRTVDQFDLTTTHPIKAYTKRAQLFADSLSFISFGSIAYIGLALFQPLKARRADQTVNRQQMSELLANYKAPSEDFFKIWPHDKQYYFNVTRTAGLAFRLHHRVALCLGDPIGDPRDIKRLLSDFATFCQGNDWLPAFIHTEAKYQAKYQALGYSLQLIGREAIVDISHFQNEVANNKYFRHIQNRFDKLGFNSEVLAPPHHSAVIERLRQVSNEWLDRPGRSERGFVMGYFSELYMQQCNVMVARDAAGTIQAFVNLVPAEFDSVELTFDLLRSTTDSPTNLNDYLLLNLIAEAADQNYIRLNLGLSPLVGLDNTQSDAGLIDNFLRFAYANGDRFYSFSGLHRFKAKYEPNWSDRFIVYKGGVRGFSRTMNSLMRAMRVKL